MRKIKLKPPKLKIARSDRPVYIVLDSYVRYQLMNYRYEKHQLAELGKRIFATLRGESYAETFPS